MGGWFWTFKKNNFRLMLRLMRLCDHFEFLKNPIFYDSFCLSPHPLAFLGGRQMLNFFTQILCSWSNYYISVYFSVNINVNISVEVRVKISLIKFKNRWKIHVKICANIRVSTILNISINNIVNIHVNICVNNVLALSVNLVKHY